MAICLDLVTLLLNILGTVESPDNHSFTLTGNRYIVCLALSQSDFNRDLPFLLKTGLQTVKVIINHNNNLKCWHKVNPPYAQSAVAITGKLIRCEEDDMRPLLINLRSITYLPSCSRRGAPLPRNCRPLRSRGALRPGRLQFPIRLVFAMSIKKSQGQSLQRVSL